MSLTTVTQQEIDLILRAYDRQELARKYILATKDCIEAEQEVRKLRQELSRVEYTLLGVMHSVDKWLDGAELEQDEVNRAATMREKTLRIVEELARENEELKVKIF